MKNDFDSPLQRQRKSRLLNITKVPFIHIRASKDHIVPLPCSVPVLESGRKDKEEIVVEAGHVGIFIGKSGHKQYRSPRSTTP